MLSVKEMRSLSPKLRPLLCNQSVLEELIEKVFYIWYCKKDIS
jgi:hypothetical protein